MRSFSNLWFWIAIAVFWSTTSHFVVGVPHDLVRRAAREGGQALADVEALAHVYTRRILFISREGGLVLVGFMAFLTAGLLTLAVFYHVEFAQAVLCILLPMLAVTFITIRSCLRIEADALTGEALIGRLRRHRVTVQTVGMLSLFLTGLFGMYQNLTIGALG